MREILKRERRDFREADLEGEKFKSYRFRETDFDRYLGERERDLREIG